MWLRTCSIYGSCQCFSLIISFTHKLIIQTKSIFEFWRFKRVHIFFVYYLFRKHIYVYYIYISLVVAFKLCWTFSLNVVFSFDTFINSSLYFPFFLLQVSHQYVMVRIVFDSLIILQFSYLFAYLHILDCAGNRCVDVFYLQRKLIKWLFDTVH